MKPEIVYHYLSACCALDDIRNRWIKVSFLDELNDPFEFSGLKFRNKTEIEAMEMMKDKVSNGHGVICFSKNWEKLTMWSHYAEKHTGICLGFDVLKEDNLKKVDYRANRYDAPPDPPADVFEIFKKKLLFTKFSDWKYEDEYRMWVDLPLLDRTKDLYFYNFADNSSIKLNKVIIGLRSKVTPDEIYNALGDMKDKVTIYKVKKSDLDYKLKRDIVIM